MILIFLNFILAAGDGLGDLLTACFDQNSIAQNGLPSRAKFTAAALDDFRDVILEMEVNGRQAGTICNLRWIEERPGEIIPKGSIKSVLAADVSTLTERMYDETQERYLPTGIELEIHGGRGSSPYVTIESLHPNNFTSGKFVRSLVVQIVNAHNEMFGTQAYTYVDYDGSLNRELYWLENPGGKTYYQDVWNLEYDCILSKGTAAIYEARARLRDADEIAAVHAFQNPQNYNFEPETGANYSDDDECIYQFTERFQAEIKEYVESKEENALDDMTIRQVLDEFVPQWKSKSDISKMIHQDMAQQTLVFFFRQNQHWHTIANQVLLGYEWDCNSMRGYTQDLTPRSFTFTYTPRVSSPSQGSGSDSPSSTGSGTKRGHDSFNPDAELGKKQRSEERIGKAIYPTQESSFFTSSSLFLFFATFIIVLTLLLQRRNISHFHHLDMYVEL